MQPKKFLFHLSEWMFCIRSMIRTFELLYVPARSSAADISSSLHAKNTFRNCHNCFLSMRISFEAFVQALGLQPVFWHALKSLGYFVFFPCHNRKKKLKCLFWSKLEFPIEQACLKQEKKMSVEEKVGRDRKYLEHFSSFLCQRYTLRAVFSFFHWRNRQRSKR